ncbi:DUF2787 family protein [Paraglaciecola sp. Hal342]
MAISYCCITDFAYVGIGSMAGLAKELDFEVSGKGVFQNFLSIYPVERGIRYLSNMGRQLFALLAQT